MGIYLNKVTLIGNLTREVELKALPSGTKVANFSIATNRNWKDKDGAKKEEVEYHNLVAFGRTAEVISEWVHKGDQIYIEGRLKTTSWDDKSTGVKRYKTEVMVESFQFGSKKAGNAPKTNEKAKTEDSVEYPNETEPSSNTADISTSSGGVTEDLDIESIPF